MIVTGFYEQRSLTAAPWTGQFRVDAVYVVAEGRLAARERHQVTYERVTNRKRGMLFTTRISGVLAGAHSPAG